MTVRDPRGMLLWTVAMIAAIVALPHPAVHLLAAGAAAAVASASGGRSVRTIVLLCISLTFLRVLLFALTGHSGTTTLFTLPAASLPAWLGGLQVGGSITAEVVVSGAVEGLRLTAILLCIAACLSRCDVIDLLRLTPRHLRTSSMIVNISLTLAPKMVSSARQIRDAQRMRGGRSGRLSLVSTIVPTVATALESSVSLAEAMESRGFGSGASMPRRSRDALMASLLIASSLAALAMLGVGWPLSPALAAVALMMVVLLLRGSGTSPTLIGDRRHLIKSPGSIAAASILAALIVTHLIGGVTAFDPYTLSLPPPGLTEVVTVALGATPAMRTGGTP